jgi:two-component system sensor histidine kinase HydH
MGRMTAGIAHEIRNPLGIIRGAGEHLARLLADRGIEDEVVSFIPEEVDRLDRILAGYLAFGTDALGELEDVDLASVVRRTVRLVAPDLAVDVTEPLPAAPCRGDPRRLQQVLLNLLLNARDAMPAGGRVTVGLSSAGGRHRVTVADEGTGLQGAARDRAFEPFWTSKDKGGGLGLAVSRRIAREHGGDLTLADRADASGCVATLELPAR